MTIDAHAHASSFPGYVKGEIGIEDLVRAWDEAEVELGLISELDSHDPAAGNDRTAEKCDKYPGRVFGSIYLNPNDVQGAISELNRLEGDERFRGVKLHPTMDAYYPFLERYFPVYARIEELGLPILWHTGTSPYSSPLQVAVAAARFPGVPFILGHFALSDLSWECFPAAEMASNVFVETSGNPIVPLMDEWLVQFGPERMLWGSDFPFYQVRYELEKIGRLSVDAEAMDLIRDGNARRIYGVDAA